MKATYCLSRKTSHTHTCLKFRKFINANYLSFFSTLLKLASPYLWELLVIPTGYFSSDKSPSFMMITHESCPLGSISSMYHIQRNSNPMCKTYLESNLNLYWRFWKNPKERNFIHNIYFKKNPLSPCPFLPIAHTHDGYPESLPLCSLSMMFLKYLSCWILVSSFSPLIV